MHIHEPNNQPFCRVLGPRLGALRTVKPCTQMQQPACSPTQSFTCARQMSAACLLRQSESASQFGRITPAVMECTAAIPCQQEQQTLNISRFLQAPGCQQTAHMVDHSGIYAFCITCRPLHPIYSCPSSLTCCWHEALASQCNGHPVQELLTTIKQLTSTVLLMSRTVSLQTDSNFEYTHVNTPQAPQPGSNGQSERSAAFSHATSTSLHTTPCPLP